MNYEQMYKEALERAKNSIPNMRFNTHNRRIVFFFIFLPVRENREVLIETLKHQNDMKKILDDIKAENFTKQEFIVYGIIVPLAIAATAILGG